MPLQKWSDQIWVSQMSPPPAFADDIETLENAYEAANPAPDIVIDLSEVPQLNSSNLSQMLAVRKLVGKRGGRLRVAGPTDGVWSVMLTAGLDKVFSFSQNTAFALADLQMNGEGA